MSCKFYFSLGELNRGKTRSSFHKFCEHFFGIDGDEDAAAAGEHFIFIVENLGCVHMGASLFFDFAAFDAQGLVQRDWLEVFNHHFAR